MANTCNNNDFTIFDIITAGRPTMGVPAKSLVRYVSIDASNDNTVSLMHKLLAVFNTVSKCPQTISLLHCSSLTAERGESRPNPSTAVNLALYSFLKRSKAVLANLTIINETDHSDHAVYDNHKVGKVINVFPANKPISFRRGVLPETFTRNRTYVQKVDDSIFNADVLTVSDKVADEAKQQGGRRRCQNNLSSTCKPRNTPGNIPGNTPGNIPGKTKHT
jgi:hypothetical protein